MTRRPSLARLPIAEPPIGVIGRHIPTGCQLAEPFPLEIVDHSVDPGVVVDLDGSVERLPDLGLFGDLTKPCHVHRLEHHRLASIGALQRRENAAQCTLLGGVQEVGVVSSTTGCVVEVIAQRRRLGPVRRPGSGEPRRPGSPAIEGRIIVVPRSRVLGRDLVPVIGAGLVPRRNLAFLVSALVIDPSGGDHEPRRTRSEDGANACETSDGPGETGPGVEVLRVDAARLVPGTAECCSFLDEQAGSCRIVFDRHRTGLDRTRKGGHRGDDPLLDLGMNLVFGRFVDRPCRRGVPVLEVFPPRSGDEIVSGQGLVIGELAEYLLVSHPLTRLGSG